ncbi:MAG: hypothetical protein U1E76_18595 [Planctomycetota bacterium]
MVNSIVWGNSAIVDDQINSSGTSVSCSDIEGGYAGAGIDAGNTTRGSYPSRARNAIATAIHAC